MSYSQARISNYIHHNPPQWTSKYDKRQKKEWISAPQQRFRPIKTKKKTPLEITKTLTKVENEALVTVVKVIFKDLSKTRMTKFNVKHLNKMFMMIAVILLIVEQVRATVAPLKKEGSNDLTAPSKPIRITKVTNSTVSEIVAKAVFAAQRPQGQGSPSVSYAPTRIEQQIISNSPIQEIQQVTSHVLKKRAKHSATTQSFDTNNSRCAKNQTLGSKQRTHREVDENCCTDFQQAEKALISKSLLYNQKELFDFLCREELSPKWQESRKKLIEKHIELVYEGISKLRVQPENTLLFTSYRSLLAYLAQKLPNWDKHEFQLYRDAFILCEVEEFTNGDKNPLVRCIQSNIEDNVQRWLSSNDPGDKQEAIRQINVLHQYLQVLTPKEIFSYGALNGIPPQGSDVPLQDIVTNDTDLDVQIEALVQALDNSSVPYQLEEVRNFLCPEPLTAKWIQMRNIFLEKHLINSIYAFKIRDQQGKLFFDSFKSLLIFNMNFPYWAWKTYAKEWSCNPECAESWNMSKGCYSIGSEDLIESTLGKGGPGDDILDGPIVLENLALIVPHLSLEELLSLKKRTYFIYYYSKDYPNNVGMVGWSIPQLEGMINNQQSLHSSASSEETIDSAGSSAGAWLQEFKSFIT